MLPETPSDDVQGRSIWALGTAVVLSPTSSMHHLSVRLVQQAIPLALAGQSPRGWAFSLIGLCAYLTRYPGDTNVRRAKAELATRLHKLFLDNSDPGWPWCEDIVTYDNAKLPHALILAGRACEDEEMLHTGLKALRWLVDLQITPEGRVSLIGNSGWLRRDGHRARFDQQPIEAMAMVEACAAAYRATDGLMWVDRARQFLDWFTGNNELGTPMYDYQTGGCRDGLCADGPNLNQGAESTLAWLISLLTMREILQSRVIPAGVEQRLQMPPEPDNGRVVVASGATV